MAQAENRQQTSAGDRGWYQRRTVDIEAEKQRAAADRREAWDAETRRLANAPPGGVNAVPRTHIETPTDDGAFAAGWRGFVDEGSFGTADLASSALRATAAPGPGWLGRFHENLEFERGRDELDEARHPVARNTGRVTGAAATLLVPVGGEATVAKFAGKAAPKVTRFLANANAAKRLAPLATNSREIALSLGARAGVGGVLGAANKGVNDVILGVDGTLPDYGLAVLRGVSQNLLRNPIAGALLNGGDAAIQAARRGQPLFSLRTAADVGSAALEGAAQVHTADKAGRIAVQSQTPKTKGRLGEALSEIKSYARGEGVQKASVNGERTKVRTRIAVPGGYSIPDHLTEFGRIVEAKMGAQARLTKRQIEAMAKLPGQYRLDAWLPRDIGATTGGLWGAFAASPDTQHR